MRILQQMILQNSGEIIYVSYLWKCSLSETCKSELNLYSLPNITNPGKPYYSQRFEYMRNNTGSNELIRIWYQTTGMRLIIKGYNIQSKTSPMLILLHAGMIFVFVGLIPYIFDFCLLWWHPNKKIKNEKYIYIDENYRPQKLKRD